MQNTAPIRAVTDYFAVLGLSHDFALDNARLDEAYFAMQNEYHPDRLGNKPPAERQQALQRSMDINEAYRALKTPLGRAQHLLALHGTFVCTDHDNVKPDPTILEEVMEWREAIGDAENDEARATLASMLEATQATCIQKTAEAFTTSRVGQAAMLTLRIHYLEKVRQELAQAGMKRALP